ncbi:uncharacterized mitochondrial protein AtMg00860-like [Solanum tuberosum]|uniref:uncharacterized mitochondrial protein AtMg00860-like n=1 Tax=Solanum tuberosum TaxID=4113 RepID=UPI00073A2EEB|nr:PREDICTED: uncharacterized mitochondrial protein AtMg00860-like [Solanum tuberosum]
MVSTIKIEAIHDWTKSTSSTKVQSFISLTGYCKRFVEDFTTIAARLTWLTHFHVPFEWTEECELKFWKIKELLTIAPILTLPVDGEGFMVYCDAFNIDLDESHVLQYGALELDNRFTFVEELGAILARDV